MTELKFSQVGSARHFRWLRWIIAAVLVLNVLDAILTLLWVESGRAREANLLLAPLIDQDPLLFVAVKFALVLLGALLLWRLRTHRLAVVSIFVAFLAYYWLLLYHLRLFISPWRVL